MSEVSAPALRRLDKRELVTGRTLPADLHDQTGQVIFRKGHVLVAADQEMLAARAAAGVFVTNDWQTLAPAPAPAAPSTSSAAKEILEALKRTRPPKVPTHNRKHPRHDWRVKLTIVVEERSSTGARKRALDVETCDLSAGGFAFLSPRYLHPQTLIRVQFTTLPQRPIVTGVVQHCVYTGDGVHRIGIKFMDPSNNGQPAGEAALSVPPPPQTSCG